MSATKRRPSLPPMPDLAHLTEEERKIIESVLQRQREEEEKEQEILRNLQDEFESYQESVKKLGEEVKQVMPTGTTQEAVCEICHKTKFADGVGHQCHYCHVKSCARCGGKMLLRNKVCQQEIWACNICKKKHDILVKTGQWYHGGMAKPVGLDVDTGSDASSVKTESSPLQETRSQFPESGPSQPRPSMARQESLKGNLPTSVSLRGKELRRQYSLTDTKRLRDGSGGGGSPFSDQKHSGRDVLLDPAEQIVPQERDNEMLQPKMNHDKQKSDKLSSVERQSRHVPRDGAGIENSYKDARNQHESGYADRRVNDSLMEGKHSNLEMRGNTQDWLESHEQLNREDVRRRDGSRTRRSECELVERHKDQAYAELGDMHRMSRVVASGGERLRDSSPLERHRDREYHDRLQRISPEKVQDKEMTPRRVRHDDMRRIEQHHGNAKYPVVDALSSPTLERHPERLMQGHNQPISKDMDKFGKYASKSSTGQSRNRGERNIYLEGECFTDSSGHQHLDPNSAAATKYANRFRRRGENLLRNDSLGSDLFDCTRPPTLKSHKPRKGSKHSSVSSSDDEMPTTPEGTSWEDQDVESNKGQRYKSGYNFIQHGGSPEKWKKDEILAAKITKFLTHPASWKLSADGTKLIGHMVLCKFVDGLPPGEQGGILGLKVTGGKMTEYGYLGAFITKVKRGSIADTVAQLKAGDEVVEWNGHNLRGLTFEEVYDIIFESKSDPQVELTVERPVSRAIHRGSGMSEQLEVEV